MDRQLIEYLPEWLREFREIKILCEKYQIQLERLWLLEEAVYENNFVSSLDVRGCERWEKVLGIQNKDTYSLGERRNNIAGRIAEQRPFTYARLRTMLDSICGKGGYKAELLPEIYTLTVKLELTSKNMLSDVRTLLERIVPANLIRDIDLLYNTYSFLRPYTYEQLGQYTCRQLREDVL